MIDTSEYLDGIRANAALFLAAARAAGVDAPVPTCPDWTVADLARHQGRVHRWVSTILETKAQEFVNRKEFEEEARQAADPLAWLEGGAEMVLEVLGGTDPDLPVWNWIDDGPGPARFWYRRMAHETAVHRVDAEAAAAAPAAAPSRVEPAELASDGIDEYLQFLPLRAERGGT